MLNSSKIVFLFALMGSIFIHILGVSVFFFNKNDELDGISQAAISSYGSQFADFAIASPHYESEKHKTPISPISEAINPTRAQMQADVFKAKANQSEQQFAYLSDIKTQDNFVLRASPASENNIEHKLKPDTYEKTDIIEVKEIAQIIGEKSRIEPEKELSHWQADILPKPLNRPATAPILELPKPKISKHNRPKSAGQQSLENKGNAAINAQKGTQSGKNKKSAVASSGESSQNQQGNAAASKYPSLVKRKVARAMRFRGRGKGFAHISFSLTPKGGLASVRLTKSSSDKKIDQAALEAVKRAAPFPKPPRGAQRQFTISLGR